MFVFVFAIDARILSTRALLTAEKALLDVAYAIYKPTVVAATGKGEVEVFRNIFLYTGWTPPPPLSNAYHSSAEAGRTAGSVSPVRVQMNKHSDGSNSGAVRDECTGTTTTDNSRSGSPSRTSSGAPCGTGAG